MPTWVSTVERWAGWVLFAGLMGWVFYSWWRKTEDRPGLLFRWILTLADIGFIFWVIGPVIKGGGYEAGFLGGPLAAVAGLVMALIWVPYISEWVGRRAVRIFDDGDIEPQPEPFYSVALARRKQGKTAEAVAEVEGQLERFPTNLQGHLLLAEIQADDLHDLDAATGTIERFVGQPGHAPKNVAFALTRLADWHLKYRQNLETARSLFERIVALFPGSPEALLANQRLARLGSGQYVRARTIRMPIAQARGDEELGLRTTPPESPAPVVTPHQRMTELIAQLERFPLDNQAREELALLYTQDFARPDLGAEQLEELIGQPDASDRQVIHWLNMLADVQMKAGGDPVLAREALRRIMSRYPDSAAAKAAERRLGLLNLQGRPLTQSPTVPFAPPAPPDAP